MHAFQSANSSRRLYVRNLRVSEPRKFVAPMMTPTEALYGGMSSISSLKNCPKDRLLFTTYFVVVSESHGGNRSRTVYCRTPIRGIVGKRNAVQRRGMQSSAGPYLLISSTSASHHDAILSTGRHRIPAVAHHSKCYSSRFSLAVLQQQIPPSQLLASLDHLCRRNIFGRARKLMLKKHRVAMYNQRLTTATTMNEEEVVVMMEEKRTTSAVGAAAGCDCFLGHGGQAFGGDEVSEKRCDLSVFFPKK